MIPIINGIAGLVDTVVSRVWPDKTKIQEQELELVKAQLTAELSTQLAQIQVNETEAKSENVFVSGWRPFIGWCCGSALAYTYILQPFLLFFVAVFNIDFNANLLPTINLGELMPILLGMLGLGAYRTYEKVSNSNKNR